MTKCACEFQGETCITQCQLHKELAAENRRLKLLNPQAWDRCCLRCWMIDSINAWFEGGFIHRDETLSAISGVTIQVLMADEVPDTKEMH